eukprot:UN29618
MEHFDEYNLALNHFQQVLRLTPNSPGVHYKLGVLYERHLDKHEEGLKHYQNGLEMYTKYACYLLEKKNINIKKGHNLALIRELKKIPEFAQLHNNIGIIYETKRKIIIKLFITIKWRFSIIQRLQWLIVMLHCWQNNFSIIKIWHVTIMRKPCLELIIQKNGKT